MALFVVKNVVKPSSYIILEKKLLYMFLHTTLQYTITIIKLLVSKKTKNKKKKPFVYVITHHSTAWYTGRPSSLLFNSILINTPTHTDGQVALNNIVFSVWFARRYKLFTGWYSFPSQSCLTLLLTHGQTGCGGT